jgi:oligopeptidase B
LNTAQLRFVYDSLITPERSVDYDMSNRSETVVKQEKVLGGFVPAHYETKRLQATAIDGKKVPISIVYSKDKFHKDSKHFLLLRGYGAYGLNNMEASFQTEPLWLLDRGFVCALANIRGGQELGRDWYDNGKLLEKKNSFTDFIACAEYLIREKYTDKDHLFAEGLSAGGLLMGVVANRKPDLFKGIVARSPFVDVVNTMLDPSLPETIKEYNEWGDPTKSTDFKNMLLYSPYDNVGRQNYPNMLVTFTRRDSLVKYWEPLMWVAKLRATKTDSNRLLLHEYDGEHEGPTGRYERF